MTRPQGYVVAEADVEERRADGMSTRVTIDRSAGCERLEQRVVRFAEGQSGPRRLDGAQEVLYVAAGSGTLELDGQRHALEPGTGAFVADGETYAVDNPGPGELVVVVVRAPAEGGAGPGRKVTVRWAEQPQQPASHGRDFRYLVNQDAGCLDVTQFVGVIPPGRAPDHSHTYDEVVYVLEGEGVLHLSGRDTPIGAGSCIHLPPLVTHSLENLGATPMRILGVFHPSGDPASLAAENNNRGSHTSQGPPSAEKGGTE